MGTSFIMWLPKIRYSHEGSTRANITRKSSKHNFGRPIHHGRNQSMKQYLHQVVGTVRAQKPGVLAGHFDLLEPEVTVARLVIEVTRCLSNCYECATDRLKITNCCLSATRPGSSSRCGMLQSPTTAGKDHSHTACARVKLDANHENVGAECSSPLGQVMTSTTGRCPRFYTVVQENAIITLQKEVIALGKRTSSTEKKI